jgi:phenol 2-monooxygenase (NADPH)
MLTTWLSRLGIRTRIVDKRGTKIFNGQADGLQCRTLEIFDSLGFVDRAWRESNHMLEICLWNPGQQKVLGDAGEGYRAIERSDRIPDTIPGISRFQQVVLHQGRIERFMLDVIKEESVRTGCNGTGTEGEIKVEHGVLPTELKIEEGKLQDLGEYPVEVRLRHLTEEEATPSQKATSVNGKGVMDGLFRSNLASDDTEELVRGRGLLEGKAGREEVVKAKYLVGADGAHSWVRGQLGPLFQLKGEQTDYR